MQGVGRIFGPHGIGTTTPSSKLEVAGFLHTRGGAGNTALGKQALENVTTGTFNTANGASALYSNTTGNLNTAGGAGALYSNTTGRNNTATGKDALRYNTTGYYNTANGVSALRSNTTGIHNTATGHGALRSNTTAYFNTASGAYALSNNTTGVSNTAAGSVALSLNTTGNFNTANGVKALYNNTTGSNNTAAGADALSSNTTGVNNTASVFFALRSNTTGLNNTASGFRALHKNTTGVRNIALGYGAGRELTTGYFNIAIGHDGVYAESATIRIGTVSLQTRAFIAGIRGVTTDVVDAVNVMIDSDGQLGTISSSRRFKEDIEDMGETTARLLELRPVVFRYKQHVATYGDAASTEYGLIAEEVAEVFPDLVVYDDEGEPFTVKYHLLSSMLLNELQKQHDRCEAHDTERDAENDELRARLERLEALAGESLGE